jgi:hypothetical protein
MKSEVGGEELATKCFDDQVSKLSLKPRMRLFCVYMSTCLRVVCDLAGWSVP